MEQASEVIYGLEPVSFRYKPEIEPTRPLGFGLIVEEAEKISPDLVTRSADAKVNGVRYDQVNAMLLNEFLKEHKKVEEQQASIAELKSTVAQQQKGMEVLTAQLKEQAAQIQKVSAQLEVSKPATKVVLNNP
jgi:septal ring factor EnvC (AmiA/AmiB activator)